MYFGPVFIVCSLSEQHSVAERDKRVSDTEKRVTAFYNKKVKEAYDEAKHYEREAEELRLKLNDSESNVAQAETAKSSEWRTCD